MDTRAHGFGSLKTLCTFEGEVFWYCPTSSPNIAQVRVQQTIQSQESSIVSYKIANLLQFYLVTMYRTIGEHALLSTTLKEYVPALVLDTDFAPKTMIGSRTFHTRCFMNPSWLKVKHSPMLNWYLKMFFLNVAM
jgi:cbb3-type cytochrome oxidase subunit 1